MDQLGYGGVFFHKMAKKIYFFVISFVLLMSLIGGVMAGSWSPVHPDFKRGCCALYDGHCWERLDGEQCSFINGSFFRGESCDNLEQCLPPCSRYGFCDLSVPQCSEYCSDDYDDEGENPCYDSSLGAYHLPGYKLPSGEICVPFNLNELIIAYKTGGFKSVKDIITGILEAGI